MERSRSRETQIRTVMNLFPDLPEDESPRLKWMKERGIKTLMKKDDHWVAYKSGTQHNFTHENEIDAVVGLAKKLKIKLWKE